MAQGPEVSVHDLSPTCSLPPPPPVFQLYGSPGPSALRRGCSTDKLGALAALVSRPHPRRSGTSMAVADSACIENTGFPAMSPELGIGGPFQRSKTPKQLPFGLAVGCRGTVLASRTTSHSPPCRFPPQVELFAALPTIRHVSRLCQSETRLLSIMLAELLVS